jgi:hypothetical protein
VTVHLNLDLPDRVTVAASGLIPGGVVRRLTVTAAVAVIVTAVGLAL